MTPEYHPFYTQMLISVGVWWTLVSIAGKRPLYDASEGSVITIPSWLPKQVLVRLQQKKYRSIIFYGQTIGLSLAYCFGAQYTVVRIIAAILFTFYHLIEHSETNRHGEFPVLYSMWAMCLYGNVGATANDDRQDDDIEDIRQACVWGIAIHFILSSGYSKIVVGCRDRGGMLSSSSSWIHPCTMEAYLTCFRQYSTTKLSKPISPKLNERICSSKLLCTSISIFTILFECIITPGSLFMTPEQRPIVCYTMIGFHVGIALFMSKKVGIVFITSLPVYIYGFCHGSSSTSFYVGTTTTTPWIIAATVGLGPTLSCILMSILPSNSSRACSDGRVTSSGRYYGGEMISENWPLSPISLFMWNGKSAQCIMQLLMVGDKRLVLATSKVASKQQLIGLRVLHQGETISSVKSGSVVIIKKRIMDDTTGDDDNDEDSTTLRREDEQGEEEDVVHDCIMRTLSFTIVHGDEIIIDAIEGLCNDPDIMNGNSARKLVHRTWAWLSLERRMVEAHTGEDLTHVYFVRVDPQSKRITEVII